MLFLNLDPLAAIMSLNPPCYGSPPEPDPALSLQSFSHTHSARSAKLTLQLLRDQSLRGASPKDAKAQAEPGPGMPIKGKPRLLLMGQRRYSLHAWTHESLVNDWWLQEWQVVHLKRRLPQTSPK
jgi:hypothetical protein